ncbi:MAG: UDP-N-acetylglucosamine 1-carboxyvinyltransferase, partial [Clostridia bacterium]|nr:UDP-N-acetylglucosamine 1-carboxyvinyltransferase [Clostridia bacterium]
MRNYVIEGGRPLWGTVPVSGAKNAALPMLFGALACGSPCELVRVPRIGDVRGACEIIREAGAQVAWETDETGGCEHRVHIRAPRAIKPQIEGGAARMMRASYYLLGAALARGERVRLPLPGGCALGERPIDLHLAVFSALGARVRVGDGYVEADGSRGLRGADFSFGTTSVGATVNGALAALGAEGTTVLRGASTEPHVCDFLRFLAACGASVDGIGTTEVRVTGGRTLHGRRYRIGGDMAEAGTYLIAGVLTGGSVTARGIDPAAMAPLTRTLRRIGASVTEEENEVTATDTGVRRGVLVETGPFP